MVTQLNRSDACKFANYVTDLIQTDKLKASDDGKFWVTHDHFNHWMFLESKLIDKHRLIDFGHYLFSDERRELFKNHPEFGDKNLEERLMGVHESDISNFMERPIK